MATVEIRAPDVIADDGFQLAEAQQHVDTFALLSLRIALRSYFTTYRSMAYSLHAFTDANIQRRGNPDYMHATDYCALSGQTIIHFQHFAELILKDCLRAQHELLVTDAGNKPLLLLKLLRSEKLTSTETEDLYAVEFRVALERVLVLLDANKLDTQFAFIKDAAPFLRQLTRLRNRLLHAGTFVLRFPALDELVGAYLFPFVKQVTALPAYSKHEAFWKHNRLKCGIDPLEVIMADWQKGEYNINKVALLKEMGRAGYEAAVPDELFADMTDSGERRRAARSADFEVDNQFAAASRECPVCGVKALVRYEDCDVDFDVSNNPLPGLMHPYMHRCHCCTFEVNYHLDNPSDYGLPIADFW